MKRPKKLTRSSMISPPVGLKVPDLTTWCNNNSGMAGSFWLPGHLISIIIAINPIISHIRFIEKIKILRLCGEVLPQNSRTSGKSDKVKKTYFKCYSFNLRVQHCEIRCDAESYKECHCSWNTAWDVSGWEKFHISKSKLSLHFSVSVVYAHHWHLSCEDSNNDFLSGKVERVNLWEWDANVM